MSQVVSFKVQSIRKSSFLMAVSGFNTDDSIIYARITKTFIALLYQHRSMDIAICALSLGYLMDKVIHKMIQLRILCNRIDCGTGFQPLIHITVKKRSTDMAALSISCCNFKIAKAM